MGKRLKVGIVGTGSIWKSHLPGWQQSPDAELAAIADVNPEALRQAKELTGVKLAYDKAADLFANPEIDVVDVCTANQFHAPLVIEALKAGKHVLCEKPLAPTPQEIKNIIAARNRSGKLLMTAQHRRFEPDSQVLKSEIDQGVLGDVYHARCWALRRSGAPTRPSFVTRKCSGGGPCIDIGVHALDLALWMMGHPRPVSVSGITQDKLRRLPGAFIGNGTPIPEYWDVEEFAAAFVRFDTGASLILETSWMLHHREEWEENCIYLYGTKGGARWPQNEIATTNFKTRRYQDVKLCPVSGGMEAHAAECVAFARAIVEGKPSPVPAEESLDVVSILDGVYRSAGSAKEVVLER